MPVILLDDPTTVVVTASRVPEEKQATAASVALIEPERIERMAPPLVTDLLRLTPSVSVATSGPAGSLTQVRIRGAEANHTLLFIDGIRANDPAAANEPRFELLNADLADRIEVVRGPQSALWGSEAIGGVIAVEGAGPGKPARARVEAGSFGFRRAAAGAGLGTDDRGISFGLFGQRADGIDGFDGSGDRDGYRNAGGRVAGEWRLSPGLRAGAAGFALAGRSEFDGYDPLTFLHADTRDESRNRLAAARVFAEGGRRDGFYARATASLLGSSNRNYLDRESVNRTTASRRTVAIESGATVGRQRIVAALDAEGERFTASDAVYFGASDQRRTRAHRSATFEWLSDFKALRTDVAIRRDLFSRFKDATSLRASATLPLGGGIEAVATYSEGIAQPSFFDLYGFFPGSFVGNPALRPERSRGGEVSLRRHSQRTDLFVTAYRQRLSDEIVGTFDSATFLSSTANAVGRSKRHGLEVGGEWRIAAALNVIANYAFLNASEPAIGTGQLREQRRPRHSGSVAIDGIRGRFTYGASLAYVGARIDTDFDRFPAERVRLSPYTLLSARVGFRVTPGIEVSVRAANALDTRYVDAVGYRTEGRSVNVGLRLTLPR